MALEVDGLGRDQDLDGLGLGVQEPGAACQEFLLDGVASMSALPMLRPCSVVVLGNETPPRVAL